MAVIAMVVALHVSVLCTLLWVPKPVERVDPTRAPAMLVVLVVADPIQSPRITQQMDPQEPTSPPELRRALKHHAKRKTPPGPSKPEPQDSQPIATDPTSTLASSPRDAATRLHAISPERVTPPSGMSPTDYVARLSQRLAEIKRYPQIARALREEGTVVLYFQLDRTGRVLNWHIARSSGHAALDREVTTMIVAASPFPPFPATIDKARESFLVPIEFSLRR